MDRIENLIRSKKTGVMLHGSSISNLEDKIVELKDCDIIWVSIGLFTIMETFILSKINKNLSFVFDCASVAGGMLKNYENNVRLPRLKNYLDRNDNNFWVTTHGIVRDSLLGTGNNWFYEQYKNKIIILDQIFPKNKIGYWMDVPNSLTLLIAFLLKCRAERIIVFGFDGYDKYSNNLNSYYKPEFHKEEHLSAIGSEGNTGIARDSEDFKKRFNQKLKEYRSMFCNNAEIVNCVGSNCVIDCIPKISYKDLLEYMK